MLPLHIIENIISRCDPFTQGKCAMVSKDLNSFVGDARPVYIKNKEYFLKVLRDCCASNYYKFFYFRIITKDYHMIISDENGYIIYIDIMIRSNKYQKPLRRSYRKIHVVSAMKKLINGTRIFKGTDEIANKFFEKLFAHVQDISMSTHHSPKSLLEWQQILK